MTDKNAEKSAETKRVVYITSFAVPSKVSDGRFATKRFSYEVQNVKESRLIEVAGAPDTVLRASALMRVFRQDYVNSKEKLEQFDALTPGLNPTLRELTHGIYMDGDRQLKIVVKGLGEQNVPSYIYDPTVKDGDELLMQPFRMDQLLQAANGDERLDSIRRFKRPPLKGQRVGKRVTGGSEEVTTDAVRRTFDGYVFTAAPGKMTADYAAGTATFERFVHLGFVVYVPMSSIRLMLSLYTARESKWRAMIEQDHEILDGRRPEQTDARRLKLQAGRQVRKELPEAKVEAKAEAKPKKGKGKKAKDEVKAEGKAGTSEVKAEGAGEPAAPPADA